MKTGPDAFGTAKNVSGSAKLAHGTQCPQYVPKRVRERKTLKRDEEPSVPSKKSLGAQNLKTGRDAVGTAQNESESAKHENGT
jgi:hypothetical protein